MSNEELIIACKLNPELVRERVEEWAQLVAQASAVEPHDTGITVRFGPADNRTVDAGRVGALVEAEYECCPFFTFQITVDGDGLALDVTAPADARPLVDVLLARTDSVPAGQ